MAGAEAFSLTTSVAATVFTIIFTSCTATRTGLASREIL